MERYNIVKHKDILMTKYIFVTGGVVSGLGKGIAADRKSVV